MIGGGIQPRTRRELEALDRFIVAHGHPRVPAAYRDGKLPLGEWLAAARQRARAGHMQPAFRAELERRGVAFEPLRRGRPAVDWLTLLDRYSSRTGSVDVPPRHREDGRALGDWIGHMRSGLRRGSLPPELVEALDARGVTSVPPRRRPRP